MKLHTQYVDPESCGRGRPRPGLRARPIGLGLWMGLLAAGTCGCGDTTSKAGLCRVSGRVTYQGRPLSRGSLTFHPLTPNGRPTVTMIQDGKYELSAAEGLPEGRFAAEIQKASDPSALPPGVTIDEATGAEVGVARKPGPANRGKPRNTVPKPGPSPPLQTRTIEVKKDGPNTFDFDATD